jgi:uncharacterized protein
MESPAQPNGEHVLRIAQEAGIPVHSVMATAKLLSEGATVPFIARYRKEATGELDEVQIALVRDRLEQLRELDARRSAILASLKERNLLTDALSASIANAQTLASLEDIYAPFRPKKRTRATIAREKGLEPLAQLLWAQDPSVNPTAEAAAYVGRPYTTEKGPATIVDAAEALAGARDILAEHISEDATCRAALREVFLKQSILSSEVIAGKETEGAKYKDYFKWQEPLAKAPSHRILAIRRGEKEGFLMMRIAPIDEPGAVAKLKSLVVRNSSPAAREVGLATEDCYKRLLAPAMETEARIDSKRRAEEDAIKVFADNLRELLLASPLGRKTTLAIDPGFRTGCKVVVLDRQGMLLHHDVVYPDQGARSTEEARNTLLGLAARFNIEAIAIGNGTASRETEAFVRALQLPPSIPIVMVNESGASIYSASEVAREEFPDKDITVRGAVSIGRRLQDPLAELVKLDPKSIGVGQYQHDVDQNALKKSLDDVVISCVNRVGVEVNTASKQLLAYVSGIGPSLAESIVSYRNQNGPFPSREALKRVPRLGPKAFEQCAGFLRIRDGEQPLDASAVHPESYPIVEAMARDLGCKVEDLIRDGSLRSKIQPQRYVTEKVGLPTLNDILSELAKPGRDPRAAFEVFSFTDGVNKLEDVKPGMKLPGIVTNVTAFGAFVDIGVHQDGLVHISQLSDSFVSNPAEVVKPGQKVRVTVMEVDLPRKRIGLSMRSNAQAGARQAAGQASKTGPTSGNPRPGIQNRTPAAPVRPATNFGNDLFSSARISRR